MSLIVCNKYMHVISAMDSKGKEFYLTFYPEDENCVSPIWTENFHEAKIYDEESAKKAFNLECCKNLDITLKKDLRDKTYITLKRISLCSYDIIYLKKKDGVFEKDEDKPLDSKPNVIFYNYKVSAK